MVENKRYYWLKLKDDFFSSKRIKKLRKIAGGDTYTIIYLKMQLMSLKKGGFIEYSGLEESFAEELALDLDEDVENVKVTLQFLMSCGLLETSDNINYLLPFVADSIGSETASTQRSRECRIRQKEIESVAMQQPCNNLQQNCNVDIDIDKDIDIDTDIKKEKKNYRFVPPTVGDVKAYCEERGNQVDAQAFVDFYESKGWMVGKNKMKDWKASVRTWERSSKGSSKSVGKIDASLIKVW